MFNPEPEKHYGIIIFGDVEKIKPEYIVQFVHDTGFSYGGSYPDFVKGSPDESVIGETSRLLAKEGILNSSPITVCHNPQERAEKVLQACKEQRRHGEGPFWIIERAPQTFLRGVKSAKVTGANPEVSSLLRSITMVQLGSREFSDKRDPDTGIRVVSLTPNPYHFTMIP